MAEERDSLKIREDLIKGRIAAILVLDSGLSDAGIRQFTVHTLTSSASADKYPLVRSALAQVFEKAVEKYADVKYRPIIVDELPPVAGREYSEIDFILPGMLGFSLLSAAVFGVAFLFFNLRQQLVLKRYGATPIAKKYIVLGEGIARVVFQLITAVVIIGIGKLFFILRLYMGGRLLWKCWC